MNFFGMKKPQEVLDATLEERIAERQVAPGTQLHYDGELIGRLRSHHKALLDRLAKAGETAQASKFDDTRKCVHNFRLLLNEHLLEKNLRLYTYLTCCLKADPTGLELTRDTRRQTSGISRKATLFITHYTDVGINEENRTGFLAELAQIKDVLNDSFAHEERTLYTLYQPPQAYAESSAKPLPTGIDQGAPDTPVEPQPMLPREPTNMDDVVAMSPRDFAPLRRAAAG